MGEDPGWQNLSQPRSIEDSGDLDSPDAVEEPKVEATAYPMPFSKPIFEHSLPFNFALATLFERFLSRTDTGSMNYFRFTVFFALCLTSGALILLAYLTLTW